MTSTRPAVRSAAIPGPSGHVLLGVAPAFRRDALGTLLDGFRRYGDLVAYRLGPRRPRRLRRDLVAVHHPDGVHQVLTNGSVPVRRTIGFAVLAELLGQGLLTSDGAVWLRQRRSLQPLFTPRRVAGYLDLMAAEAERMAAGPEVRSGSVIDLHELMQQYTIRVVGRTLFGDDIEDVVPAMRRLVPFIGDLAQARAMQLARPPLAWPTPRNRLVVRARRQLYAVVDAMLTRRAADPAAEGADDLLSRLGRARDPDTGQPLSMQEIRDQILIFLLAGHETTAGALTFTLHLLGRHPEIQEQVFAAAIGRSPGDRDLLRASLQEGMRLFPPVYITQRLAAVDTEIGGHPVLAGTGVLLSPWVTHRHPDFWPQPDRFDPNRFLNGNDNRRYAYFPFGGGPRSCIGEHFALLEATVLLRTLLARYRVDSLDARVPLAPLITLRPAAPVRAALRAR